MERIYEEELKINLRKCVENGEPAGKNVYLFGHCEATLTLADRLLRYGIRPAAILDNSEMKSGICYKGIPVQKPDFILKEAPDQTIVLVVTRFYESMRAQLRELGFTGEVRKLVDYNTYAEYSLSEDVILKKQERLSHGREMLAALRKKYPHHFLIFCPFQALGDVYFCLSYLPEFMRRRAVSKGVPCEPPDGDTGYPKGVICVVGRGCGAVVSLFGHYAVEVLEQKELDAAVQACLYENRDDTFIAHQDRPYAVDLNCALYLKKIPLEKIYCCGVFGLPAETKPARPTCWEEYPGNCEIEKGRAVILSPYAKSVTVLPGDVWNSIVADYREKGYQVFTNVCGDETPLEGTLPIRPKISEMKSAVERAGTFIGIRSGLCDVIRTAACRKIALYPDYPYCDTKWKAIDIYALDEFENMEVKDGFEWKTP